MQGNRLLIIIPAWAALIAAILTRSLNSNECLRLGCLTQLDMILVLVASLAGGLLLGEVTVAVWAGLVALGLGGILAYIGLILPVLLSPADPAFAEQFFDLSVLRIFAALLPFGIFICVVGGVIGGLLGER